MIGRAFWVVMHRWAGLTIAVFLVIAGVTGAVLPFEETLTFATRPDAARAAPPSPGARPLDGIAIAERVERATGARVSYIPLDIAPDHVVRMFVAAAPGRPALPYDIVWADPYSGAVRLTYRWGGLGDGVVNFVPFLYSLHYGYVAGDWGVWAFGIAALIWTLDCFVGFYLTLPARPNGAEASRWWAMWRPAWRIRRARGHKLTFDLHRAGGLWLWPLLLVFAWSGVGLALPSVERPVMEGLGATAEFAPPARARPVDAPPVARREAAARSRRYLEAMGAREGLRVETLTWLSYDPASAVYRTTARTSLDWADEGGATTLWMDALDGHVLRVERPLGATGADAVMRWLYMLHMAEVFGLSYRIFVSVLGIAVAGLSVTGVLIWMRKRSARLIRGRRSAA